MRFPRFIIGLTAGIALSAQAANIDEYINQLPAGANLALMAQKVGASTPEIDYHSQQMALPASTQRSFGGAAAICPIFALPTLETKGFDGGVLKGDLSAAIRRLKRQDIRNMVATLKKAGVSVSKAMLYTGVDKAPGWPWNDLTAQIVDRNCFSVSLYSAQKPGDVAFIRVASYYPVTMFSQVYHRTSCSIASSTGAGRSQSGCLPQMSDFVHYSSWCQPCPDGAKSRRVGPRY